MPRSPKLRSELWAKAILRQCEHNECFAVLRHRGDPDAGGIMVVLLKRDRKHVVLNQTRTHEGEPAWVYSSPPGGIDAEGCESYIARQLDIDPDLWIIECEVQGTSLPFDGKIISSL